MVAPITDLTRSRASEIVKWGDSQEWAFNEIKHLLSSEPILKLPDLNKEFLLQTDASNGSLGGCLLREHGGVGHPVLCASRELLPREQSCSVGEREALAVVWAVGGFHRCLCGRHFTLESGRRPLEYLQASHSGGPGLMGWGLALRPCRCAVRCIGGAEGVVADYLSRC